MRILRNVLLRKSTSIRIGGPAVYFCIPRSRAELAEALRFASEKKLPFTVMGAGTNLLSLDSGFKGLVIRTAGGLDHLRIEGNRAVVGAGFYLPRLLKMLAVKGLSGLEFLAGVPGTVGGAVVMNAGAWGGEIAKSVVRIKVVNPSGKERAMEKRKIGFGYRKSKLQNANMIVSEIELKLKRKKRRTIENLMNLYLEKRRISQPLGIPNAGSVFKNPKGRFAGQLIEGAGGKGMRVGDAQVSTKHANFIVNLGEASARDVIKLMTRIVKIVKEKYKIQLEPELKVMVKFRR